MIRKELGFFLRSRVPLPEGRPETRDAENFYSFFFSMFLKIFNIPIPDVIGEENRMNVFTRGHRILKRTVYMAHSGDQSYVTIILEYCEGHGHMARLSALLRNISKARSAF